MKRTDFFYTDALEILAQSINAKKVRIKESLLLEKIQLSQKIGNFYRPFNLSDLLWVIIIC